MNVLKALKNRFSCRNFNEKKVSNDEKNSLLWACGAAPTGRNLQPLRFYWVESPEKIEAISKSVIDQLDDEGKERMKSRGAENIFYGAPHIIVITSVGSNYDRVDAGIAVQSVCLAATSMNLNSCIIAMTAPAFNKDYEGNVRELLGMGDDEEFMIAVAVGHSDEEKEPHEFNADAVIEIYD